MPLTWTMENEHLLVAQLHGMLGCEEFKQLQKRNNSLLTSAQNIKVLIIANEFDGWQDGAWEAVGFDERIDNTVAKMAVVMDKKWHEDMALFMAKDLRSLAIEFFAPEQETQARQWLAE